MSYQLTLLRMPHGYESHVDHEKHRAALQWAFDDMVVQRIELMDRDNTNRGVIITMHFVRNPGVHMETLSNWIRDLMMDPITKEPNIAAPGDARTAGAATCLLMGQPYRRVMPGHIGEDFVTFLAFA